MALVLKDERIHQLELEVERLRPQKRQRVKPDPNSKFVAVERIIQERQERQDHEEARVQEEEVVASDSGMSEDEEEVVLRRSTRSRRLRYNPEEYDLN